MNSIRSRITLIVVQLALTVFMLFAFDGLLRFFTAGTMLIAVVLNIIALFLPGHDGRALFTIPSRSRK